MSAACHQSPLPMRWVRLLPFLAALLLLGACTNGNLPIPAVPSSPVEGSVPYHLLTMEPVDAAELAEHRQVVGFVRAALATRGMHEVAREAAADVVVSLDYRVGTGRLTRVREPAPMYAFNPDAPYQGERLITVMRNSYEKRLRLTARPTDSLPDGRVAPDLWSLELVAEGMNRNLRKVLPQLQGAFSLYLGKDAMGSTVLEINDDTGEVETLEHKM